MTHFFPNLVVKVQKQVLKDDHWTIVQDRNDPDKTLYIYSTAQHEQARLSSLLPNLLGYNDKQRCTCHQNVNEVSCEIKDDNRHH